MSVQELNRNQQFSKIHVFFWTMITDILFQFLHNSLYCKVCVPNVHRFIICSIYTGCQGFNCNYMTVLTEWEMCSLAHPLYKFFLSIYQVLLHVNKCRLFELSIWRIIKFKESCTYHGYTQTINILHNLLQ